MTKYTSDKIFLIKTVSCFYLLEAHNRRTLTNEYFSKKRKQTAKEEEEG